VSHQHPAAKLLLRFLEKVADLVTVVLIYVCSLESHSMGKISVKNALFTPAEVFSLSHRWISSSFVTVSVFFPTTHLKRVC
jgi:hypothetical protein